MEKRSFLRIGLGLVLAELAILGLQFLNFYVLAPLAAPWARGDDSGIVAAAYMLVFYLMFYGLMILAVFLFLHGLPNMPKLPKKGLSEGLLSKPGVGRSIGLFVLLMAICFGIGYLLAFVGNLIQLLFSAGMQQLFTPIFGPPPPPGETTTLFGTIVQVAAAVIMAPVFEEIIFRRLVLDKLRPFGDVTAIIFSGLAFGFTHLNFGQFFFASFLGMIFGYVMIKTNRLIYPILMHFVFNLMGTLTGFFTDIPLVLLILLGYMVAVFVIGVTLFFTNLKRIKFQRPAFRFSRPLGGKMVLLNVGTALSFVVYLAMFVFTAISDMIFNFLSR